MEGRLTNTRPGAKTGHFGCEPQRTEEAEGFAEIFFIFKYDHY